MMTTKELELHIFKFFMDNGKYLAIIPRVHKKFKIHECDLVVVTKSEHIYEIELKVSVADCKRDKQKEHEHKDIHNRLKYQYFGVPLSIVEECEQHIPEHFGIIVVNDSDGTSRGATEVYRTATLNKTCRKITKGELINLLSTGCTRYFSLIENFLKGSFEQEESEE